MVFEDHLQCFACLSVGRKMLTIGNNSRAFQTLVPDFIQVQSSIEEALLCWECHSVVRRLTKFQNQVQRASRLIKSGQSHIYGTLSSLTTVVKTDTEPHTVYVNEPCMNVKEEDNVKQISDDENVYSPLIELTKNCDDIPKVKYSSVKKEKNEIIDDQTQKPVKRNNIWNKKRALLNRKPKFNILKSYEINVDMIIKRNTEVIPKRKSECGACDIKFENENLLIKHFREKHDSEFICDICFLLLADKARLLTHLEEHTERYACCLCEIVFKSYNLGHRHLMKVHKRVFQCVKCELTFASRRNFFRHYKEWHEKFICDYCGISFKMRYCIKDHIRKQHSPYQCKMCNKTFARYNGLWLHNKVWHGPPKQTAYCVECDKRYPDVYRYRWHLANSAKHNKKKKIRKPCPECGKIFSKNIYMKDHYNFVHLKQYKYKCEVCDKNFIRNADLRNHKKRIHDGILPPKNKICYMCGRGFTTNKILANHIRTHTGERPFACSSCPARFAQSAALAGHSRALHHDRNET